MLCIYQQVNPRTLQTRGFPISNYVDPCWVPDEHFVCNASIAKNQTLLCLSNKGELGARTTCCNTRDLTLRNHAVECCGEALGNGFVAQGAR